MVSAAIERATGLETIPHLTTRDSTVLGLESQLLGAHSEGVRNVLAITGDPPEVGDYPGSQRRLRDRLDRAHALIARLNRGEDFNGRPIDAPTSFFPGVAVNPTADDLELEARALPREGRGGRAVRDDADRLRPRRARPLRASCSAAGRCRCSPASSRSRATGSRCGCTTRCRGSSSRSRAASAARRGRGRGARSGWRIARELLAEARGRCDGVYVVAPFRPPLGVARRAASAGAARRSRPAPWRESSARARPRPARRSRSARRRAPRRSSTRRRRRVDRRAARVAVAHAARDGGDRARDRTVAVRVRASTSAVGRSGPAPRVERAVLRVAEDRDRRARPRVDEPQRRHGRAADAQHGDVVVRGRTRRRRRVQAGAVRDWTIVPCSPATTCAAVTTRSRRANQPLPSTPMPHASPRSARRRPTRARTAGSRRSRGSRARVGARRPGDRRERVDAGEQAQEPRGGTTSLSRLQDRASAALACRSFGWPGSGSADGARTQTSTSPSPRRDRPPTASRAAGTASACRPPRRNEPAMPRHRLEQQRADDRADEPGERRPRRGRRRRAAGAARGASRRTRRPRARRARARSRRARAAARRAPPTAIDAERDPVDGALERHARQSSQHRRPRPPATLPRPGGVVQLVRTPACHAGGRGFESRRSRFSTPSRPDGRAVDRLADGEAALASGALVVRGDDRVRERVRADRVGEDDD